MARLDYGSFAQHLLGDPKLHMSQAGTVFGEIDGSPTHVFIHSDDNGKQFLAVMVGTKSEEAGETVKQAWVEADDALKRSQVEVQPTGVLAKIPVGRAAKAGLDGLEWRVRELVRVAASVHDTTPMKASGSRAALVNGIPTFLTEVEAGEIRLESSAAAQEYRELRPRYGRGIAFGVIGAVIAAAVWGAIGFFFDWSGWIVAIGAGLLIGFLTVRGAGKPNRVVQLIIGVLTIAAVVVGDVLVVALVIQDDAGVFDIGVALDIYGAVIGDDTGFALFTLGAALLGAWFGSRAGRPVDVDAVVELAPA